MSIQKSIKKKRQLWKNPSMTCGRKQQKCASCDHNGVCSDKLCQGYNAYKVHFFKRDFVNWHVSVSKTVGLNNQSLDESTTTTCIHDTANPSEQYIQAYKIHIKQFKLFCVCSMMNMTALTILLCLYVKFL